MKELLNYKLQNDGTNTGGVSFYGETLKDLLEELEMPLNTPLEKINKVLSECGIKPIEL